MKVDDLIDAIGKIDLKYVEEAEIEKLPRRQDKLPRHMISWAAGIAVLLIVGSAGTLILQQNRMSQTESACEDADATMPIENDSFAEETAEGMGEMEGIEESAEDALNVTENKDFAWVQDVVPEDLTLIASDGETFSYENRESSRKLVISIEEAVNEELAENLTENSATGESVTDGAESEETGMQENAPNKIVVVWNDYIVTIETENLTQEEIDKILMEMK